MLARRTCSTTPLVEQRMRIARSGEFDRRARVSAELHEMIYGQPVRSEDCDLTMPVLIVAGAEDRTVVIKATAIRRGQPG